MNLHVSVRVVLVLVAMLGACERSPAAESPSAEAWPPAEQARALLGSARPATADALFRREQAVYGLLEAVFDSVQDKATGERAASLVPDLIDEIGAVRRTIVQRPLAERVEAQRAHGTARREALVRFARAQGRAGLVEAARAPLIASFEQVGTSSATKSRAGRNQRGMASIQACVASAREAKVAEVCSALYGDAQCRATMLQASDLRSAAAHQALAVSCSGYCALLETHPLPDLCVEPPGMLSADELRSKWIDMNVEILVLELGDGSDEVIRTLTESLF